jgi:hypothetical protein
MGVHAGIRIVLQVQDIGRAVHQRPELVVDQEAVVPLQLTGVHPPAQLDEDGNLHRTGGVKSESPLDVEGISPGWVQEAEPDDRGILPDPRCQGGTKRARVLGPGGGSHRSEEQGYEAWVSHWRKVS